MNPEKTNFEQLAEVLAAQTFDERRTFAEWIASLTETDQTIDGIACALSDWVQDNLPNEDSP